MSACRALSAFCLAMNQPTPITQSQGSKDLMRAILSRAAVSPSFRHVNIKSIFARVHRLVMNGTFPADG